MLEGLQDRLRLALAQVMVDDGMPYWKFVDVVLDFGNVWLTPPLRSWKRKND